MLKHIPYFLLIIILLISCKRKHSQQPKVDKIIALQKQFRDAPSDSSYFNLKQSQYLLLEWNGAPDSLLSENNYLMGLYFRSKKNQDSAAIYFHNATDFIQDSIKTNRQNEYFQAAWSAYLSLGKYGDCIAILKRYKSLLDEKIHSGPISWAYFNEQATYVRMRKFKKALTINEARIAFAKEKDTKNLAVAMIAMSKLKLQYFRDYDGAAKILDELITQQETLSHNIKGQINSTYGVLTYYRGDYPRALEYYEKAIHHIKQQKQSNRKFNNLINEFNNAAEVSIDLKLFEVAKAYLDTIRSFEIKNLSRNQQKALLRYELRYSLESARSSKRALAIIDSIYANLDAVYNDKLENELLALTKSNENEKILAAQKQATEVKNLKLQTRSVVMLIVTFTVALIAYLLYRQRTLRFEKQELQMQQRLLRSQMNPHFTFNTLAAIQNKLQSNTESASNYLLKFSRLLRVILENSMHNYTQLKKELESLRKYMDLQLFRFPDKFTYQINLTNLDEEDFIFIPPMLIQPFVENSIEHGFAAIDYQGKIEIILQLEGSFIRCIIRDNGKGFTDEVIPNKNSASIQLISEYIERATKSKIIFSSKNEEDEEKGVTVSFLIPTKLTEND